jgi:hypothetical protein
VGGGPISGRARARGRREWRRLGATGLAVSVLGYRCGVVGGQMLRASVPEQDQAIGRAIGIT